MPTVTVKLTLFCLLLPWVFSVHHMMLSRAAGTSPCLCPVSTEGIHHGELSLRSVMAAGGGDVRPSTCRHCAPGPWSHMPPSLDDVPQESVLFLCLSLRTTHMSALLELSSTLLSHIIFASDGNPHFSLAGHNPSPGTGRWGHI